MINKGKIADEVPSYANKPGKQQQQLSARRIGS